MRRLKKEVTRIVKNYIRRKYTNNRQTKEGDLELDKLRLNKISDGNWGHRSCYNRGSSMSSL